MPEVGSRWQHQATAEVITVVAIDGDDVIVSGESNGPERTEIGWRFRVDRQFFNHGCGGTYLPVR